MPVNRGGEGYSPTLCVVRRRGAAILVLLEEAFEIVKIIFPGLMSFCNVAW